MITLYARPFLLIATVVWILWRALLWHRRTDKNPTREVVVAATFVWSLLTLSITLFPLKIIFYDWHATSNLTPFASILQLLRDTSPLFAFENIAGNVAMFVPIGVLLPILFEELKSPGALLWRAAAISLFIEGTQFITRARAVDIDDVILNTAGAMIGLGIFTIATLLLHQRRAGSQLLQRTASTANREPLLTAALPILITAAIAIPMMLSVIADETLGGGANGIEAAALTELTDGQIVVRTDVENHTFILATANTPDGPEVVQSDFKKVLPGRYTPIGTAISRQRSDSSYKYSFTTYNTRVGEQPILVIWGTNVDAATAVRVVGSGINTELPLQAGTHFLTGIEFDAGPNGIQNDFLLTFLAEDRTPLPAFRHNQT